MSKRHENLSFSRRFLFAVCKGAKAQAAAGGPNSIKKTENLSSNAAAESIGCLFECRRGEWEKVSRAFYYNKIVWTEMIDKH